MDLKITPSGQTIVKPTALGPVANTDTKLLIYGLFQKDRVLAQDGLRVFVSSTIKECAEERAVVRDAIRSINHEPILFEDIGARPYPPRDLYKARLEISQIFVGIYRESYGWIAPGMEISGVEDEFRLATARGMDRLVYVYQTPSSRDTKLQILIDEAKNSGITIASYTDPVLCQNSALLK